jgi:hypothetical protein
MLYERALAAGAAAGQNAAPVPMVIGQVHPVTGDLLPGRPIHIAPDGPCGFAWVAIRPANGGFAKWLRANGQARRGRYGKGIEWPVRQFGQSFVRKEAAARAMAAVLEEAGIQAYADCMMD